MYGLISSEGLNNKAFNQNNYHSGSHPDVSFMGLQLLAIDFCSQNNGDDAIS